MGEPTAITGVLKVKKEGNRSELEADVAVEERRAPYLALKMGGKDNNLRTGCLRGDRKRRQITPLEPL